MSGVTGGGETQLETEQIATGSTADSLEIRSRKYNRITNKTICYVMHNRIIVSFPNSSKDSKKWFSTYCDGLEIRERVVPELAPSRSRTLRSRSGDCKLAPKSIP